MMNIGKSGSQYQPSSPQRVSCARTMSERFSDPAQRTTVTITKPIETSYDTICAAERSADSRGYFEFEAQPAMMTP